MLLQDDNIYHFVPGSNVILFRRMVCGHFALYPIFVSIADALQGVSPTPPGRFGKLSVCSTVVHLSPPAVSATIVAVAGKRLHQSSCTYCHIRFLTLEEVECCNFDRLFDRSMPRF